jgi:tryptophan synthase alpha subunit
VENFCKDAKKAGCSGLIFPDIPLEEEENENFIKFAKQNDLIPIRVLSPASTKERLQKNAQIANGFVYFVGRKGTTGAKSGLDKKLDQNLKNLKKYFKIPIAVGFGISNKSHLKALKNKADIAVIGSALLDIYNNSPKGKGLKAVEKFLKKL